MKRYSDDYEFDINLHEKKIYSQNGEDGIIEFIFSRIGTTNKFFVEFGVEDGVMCNSRYLLKKGWSGLMMDAGFWKKEGWRYLVKRACLLILKMKWKKFTQHGWAFLKSIENVRHSKDFQPYIKKEIVTMENIQSLFQKYNVPKNFDLLSIDIDYNDYWIWEAITDYYPRVVVIEYNSSLPPTESRVVPYNPEIFIVEELSTNYFGASLLALEKLGRAKGYTLVGCDSHGINAFFCKSELIKGTKIKDIQLLYKPQWGGYVNGVYIEPPPPSDKKMMEI